MESIDIFDTAIFRDVYQPTDIFQLLESVYPGFKQKRIDAEAKARSKNVFHSYKDIYTYLPGYNPEDEIKVELNHIYPNPKILSMYKRNPSRYVFISDMYLPSSTLKQFLEKCGYENPRVFVSCEEKCNKGSGLIFEKVERIVGKITKHYGDNYKADIQGAVKANIEPVFYPALQNRILNLPAVKNPMLKKFIAQVEFEEKDPLKKLVMYYAPLIYEFTKWTLKRNPNQHVYYLSRDMFMPYLIAKNILHEENVHYIYCSRRSLCPLILNGKDKCLIDKMHTIFGEDVCKQKKNEGIVSTFKYIKSTGIKNDDIIVDIGYSGTTQRVIEQALNIKLHGKYVQLGFVPKEFSAMDTKQFLHRMALTYVFLAEFIFTSPEDNMDGYTDGKPYFTPDHEERKEYAKKITQIILDENLYRKIDRMKLNIFDIEQMLIHIQNYPSMEIMELFNKPILTNRSRTESGINFNREEILKGNLLDCYNHSYAKPLFKKMLEKDPELNSLLKLLP